MNTTCSRPKIGLILDGKNRLIIGNLAHFDDKFNPLKIFYVECNKGISIQASIGLQPTSTEIDVKQDSEGKYIFCRKKIKTS